jgi:hypothetical protein
MYVCMYVRIYVRMYVCTYVRMCVCVCIYVSTYVSTYVCTYVRLHRVETYFSWLTLTDLSKHTKIDRNIRKIKEWKETGNLHRKKYWDVFKYLHAVHFSGCHNIWYNVATKCLLFTNVPVLQTVLTTIAESYDNFDLTIYTSDLTFLHLLLMHNLKKSCQWKYLYLITEKAKPYTLCRYIRNLSTYLTLCP